MSLGLIKMIGMGLTKMANLSQVVHIFMSLTEGDETQVEEGWLYII